MGEINNSNFHKYLFGNVIAIFVLIMIILVLANYIIFTKVKSTKYFVIVNIILGFCIFLLLSANDHYRFKTYNKEETEVIGGNMDNNKLRFMNNVMKGSGTSSIGSVGDVGSEGDELDKLIESLTN